MTTPKEVYRAVKDLKGFLGGPHRYGFGIKPSRSVEGQCANISTINRRFGGTLWYNENMPYPSNNKPNGHCVGVIPTEGKGGTIADLVNPQIILGQVEDVNDIALVSETLSNISGYEGWAIKT